MKCQNTPDLPQAVDAYLRWMNSAKYSRNTIDRYRRILQHFGAFANVSNIALSDLFTCETLNVFETQTSPRIGQGTYPISMRKQST